MTKNAKIIDQVSGCSVGRRRVVNEAECMAPDIARLFHVFIGYPAAQGTGVVPLSKLFRNMAAHPRRA
jgi:hypothetical protein